MASVGLTVYYEDGTTERVDAEPGDEVELDGRAAAAEFVRVRHVVHGGGR